MGDDPVAAGDAAPLWRVLSPWLVWRGDPARNSALLPFLEDTIPDFSLGAPDFKVSVKQ